MIVLEAFQLVAELPWSFQLNTKWLTELYVTDTVNTHNDR